MDQQIQLLEEEKPELVAMTEGENDEDEDETEAQNSKFEKWKVMSNFLPIFVPKIGINHRCNTV